MCELCNKIFNKSENCGIAQKSRGKLTMFSYRGGGKILLYRRGVSLWGAQKSKRGWEPVRNYGLLPQHPQLQYVVSLLFYFPEWYHLSFNLTSFDLMAQNVAHGIPLLVAFYIGKCRQLWLKVRKFFNLWLN